MQLRIFLTGVFLLVSLSAKAENEAAIVLGTSSGLSGFLGLGNNRGADLTIVVDQNTKSGRNDGKAQVGPRIRF